MGVTTFDNINATGARVKIVSALPTTPEGYFGGGIEDPTSREFAGGEMCYLSTDNRLYIQQNTSGRTASWKRLLEQFATSTTSTSTSTSTSSSTSTSTSTSSTTTSS